jgi:hypothetical protein
LIGQYLTGMLWLLILWIVTAAWRLVRKRVTVGPAAGAMMNELLNDPRPAAIEIILEERTAERDAEDRDGNLPELSKVSRKKAG